MALTQLQDTAQIEKDIEEIITKTERLRIMYEQYFMGLIKENPISIREKVASLIRKHHGENIKNARLKFRYQQGIAKFNTYCVYWDRILRKIDEGTYEKDVFRAKLHDKNPKQSEQPSDQMFDLYQNYQTAKDSLSQKLDNVSYKKFHQQLMQKKEMLEKKYKDMSISFKITTENNKVSIKPVAVKKSKS